MVFAKNAKEETMTRKFKMNQFIFLFLFFFSTLVFADVPASFVNVKVSDLLLSDPNFVAEWQDYLNKLTACVPGKYVLSQINPLLAKQFGQVETISILGSENNLCHVIMMFYAENDPRLLLPLPDTTVAKLNKYPTGLDCALRPATTDALVDFTKKLLNGEEVRITNQDPLSNLLTQDCRFFMMINGVKTYGLNRIP